jgi:hypothetical protein
VPAAEGIETQNSRRRVKHRRYRRWLSVWDDLSTTRFLRLPPALSESFIRTGAWSLLSGWRSVNRGPGVVARLDPSLVPELMKKYTKLNKFGLR